MIIYNYLDSRWKDYNFLFEELVKRDFKKRYKNTYLGVLWSMLGPLLQILIMAFVFVHFFGRDVPHFLVFVFCGKMVFDFFRESTVSGMESLTSNKGIITKMNIPKYLFLLSKNVASLANFGLLLIVFFVFVLFDGIPFRPIFLLLIYPIVTLTIFNIGFGLVLSALHVFFKDMKYLYDIFTMLLMWISAIFFSVETFPIHIQRLFLLNPIFAHIHYFRLIVLSGVIPPWHIHLICTLYAFGALMVGTFFYKRFNYRFIYYM